MVTTRSGQITSNQQELSVLFSNLSYSTVSQRQPQEVMTELDGILYPYLSIIDIYTSEHLMLYKKAIFGPPERDRYDFTRSK